MPNRLRPLLFGLILLHPRAAQAALTVQSISGGSSAAAMVAQLIGPGVTASNITFSGDPHAGGTFTGGAGIIGFNSGIVLSSGQVTDVIGPNNTTNTSTSYGRPGDADLNAMAGVTVTADAAILEFDFVPSNAILQFTFVFGSEEYPEFVGQFNDGFVLKVNGANAAKIPGTNTTVSINNVNNFTNASDYVDNAGGAFNTQLDGFTVAMTVAVSVNVGVTNHMKIAIGDALDDAVDSVVFVKAGSFIAPTPSATPSITPTFSVTPTFSESPTITLTHTNTATPSATPTFSDSPTFSATPTVTCTSTESPTFSITPTFSASPTFSITPTPSMTATITPTFTETPEPLLLTLLPPNPNPSNGSDGTFIPYRLSTDADLRIDVWTVAGERTRHLHPGWRTRGVHEEFWDQRNESGTKVASGIFIYKVTAVSALGEEKSDYKKCAVTR